MKQSEFYCSISLVKSNESLTLYSLEVKSLSIGTRNLVILYVGAPMTERIGRKAGQPSIIEVMQLKEIFEINGYDNKFFERCIRTCLKKNYSKTVCNTQFLKKVFTFSSLI